MWPCLGETEEASSPPNPGDLGLRSGSTDMKATVTTWKVETALKLLPILPGASPPARPKTAIPLLLTHKTRAPIRRREGHGPAHVRPIQHRSRGRNVGDLGLRKQQPRRQLQGSSGIALGLRLGVTGPRLPRRFLPLERNRHGGPWRRRRRNLRRLDRPRD